MVHILIIWSKAIDSKDVIINDIRNNFDIYKIFKFHWSETDFLKNLIVFYAHSQKHLNEAQYLHLLKGKMNHCGTKDFFVVVFEDKKPHLDIRETSSGNTLVNINVFDKKNEYRKITGGGHKIHTSNDDWETNKDLTVLFGKNTKDFLRYYTKNDTVVENYECNCVGTNGFESINQLFYLLNNVANYCVLRNHECLPNEYTAEGHGDIDLLVDNKNYIKYLTQATDVYGLPYRVYHTIKIEAKDVPFDFRHIGDSYYDLNWENNILKTRQFLQKGFYIPDNENQYYSLLYHAYVQKKQVAKDYEEKLSCYADKIGKKFRTPTNEAIAELDCFMAKHDYEYVVPNDKTVVFNEDNLYLSNYAFRHGKFVSQTYKDNTHIVPFFSVVYEKENSFYKRATDFLIKTECKFLKELETYDYFPKVLSSGKAKDGAFIEISRIEGEDFESFFASFRHQQIKYIKSFIQELFNALLILNEHQIIHRDITHRNIMVKTNGEKVSIGIIDFGWAIHISEIKTCKKPDGLGLWYKCPIEYSDFYSMGIILNTLIKKYCGIRPYVIRIANALLDISGKDYDNPIVLNKKLELVKLAIASRQSMTDIRRECGLLYRWTKSYIRYKLQLFTK